MFELNACHSSGQYENCDSYVDEYIFRAKLNVIDDADFLELLLRRGGAGENAGDLANALLAQFGSIVNVVNAPRDRLCSVPGVETAMIDEIVLFRAGVLCLLRADMASGPVMHTWESLRKYCEYIMLNASAEELRIVYLDKALRITREELHQRGTVDTVCTYEREIVQKALTFGASTIMFVRVRPYAQTELSKKCVEQIKKLTEYLKAFDIEVYDYVVVAPDDTVSFRDRNVLPAGGKRSDANGRQRSATVQAISSREQRQLLQSGSLRQPVHQVEVLERLAG